MFNAVRHDPILTTVMHRVEFFVNIASLMDDDRKKYHIKKARELVQYHQDALYGAVRDYTRRERNRRQRQQMGTRTDQARRPSDPPRLTRQSIFRSPTPYLRQPAPIRPLPPFPITSAWDNITTPWDEPFLPENRTPIPIPPPVPCLVTSYPVEAREEYDGSLDDPNDWPEWKTKDFDCFPTKEALAASDLLDTQNVDPPDVHVYRFNLEDHLGRPAQFLLTKADNRFTVAPFCNKALQMLGDMAYPVIEGPLEQRETEAVIYG